MKYTNDPIINLVIKRHIQRHNQGMKKFKKTMAQNTKPVIEWIDDVIEELMDAICYLTKLKQDLIKMNKKIGFRGAKRAIQELFKKFEPKVRKK